MDHGRGRTLELGMLWHTDDDDDDGTMMTIPFPEA